MKKLEDIKNLMEFFEKVGIGRLRIKEGDFEIELKKHSEDKAEALEQQCTAPKNQTTTPINFVVNDTMLSSNTKTDTIDAPMVGTYYVAPTPGATPFVKIGQSVRKGEVIGIIEAMKIMNEIEAEFDCKIVKSLVEDGQPVEYGTPLFEVEKI
ncbi:acetyl-CoA carboxylase, biotin carboxyl carrier protein [Campylobacter blaseri]|uniref:Biotin carboxyl carrier protein of acetyl-CoA carboxylase n=1 Tax=Campylobacter blaseri TaxID=2042961 RepID=A0A2P8R441_9BACT|nr:acetyl-CoA carboxylase biotin carboxyl carrier protein [Campylobacter blaseri]PSM53239.1 acetyl-CoA carboxylase, biotin carboxyl carrier protein [Campylobacter blaseri]PSM54705.1 acetyl-CoA carboxylase, biotin carboxyl carrier protein [Campylobacter blaseri]QKF86811.1 acetyl-CoA carboxylase, biotin carboxyl carrier protein [Campylobacter blaseri]